MSTVPNDIFLTGGDKYPTGAHHYMLEVLSAFDQKLFRFYMLNWARRHHKTSLAINILIKEAIKNPSSVYLYVAPTYNQAKKIIWDDPDMLFAYLPMSEVKRISRQDLLVEFKNGSILRLLGGDDPDKLRGINARGVVFDEWAVFNYIKTIWQEIFLPILRKDNTRWAMFTFTPKGQNEAFKMWLEAQKNEEWFTSELRASRAGIIPKSELKKAKMETDPLLFAQEYECAFIANEEMTFITSAMLEKLKLVTPRYSNIKKIISIDPALGGDECVEYYIENYEVKRQVIGHWDDSKVIAAEAMALGSDVGCNNFAVDYIGLGEGVYSRLNQISHYKVEPVDVRGKAQDVACFNLKSSMWWTIRKLIIDQKIPYPEDLELRRQLSGVKFEFKSGLIAAEEKTNTKKRIGCSPDRAEAYIQGLFTMLTLEPEKDTQVDDYDFNKGDETDYYDEVALM